MLNLDISKMIYFAQFILARLMAPEKNHGNSR